MAMKLRSVRMAEDDYKAMMTTSKELFLKENKQMEGMKISARFMLHKIIEYYNKPLFGR